MNDFDNPTFKYKLKRLGSYIILICRILASLPDDDEPDALRLKRLLRGTCIFIFCSLLVLLILNAMLYPPTISPPGTVTITSPTDDGITLQIHAQMRLTNHDLVWITLANGSRTPFDTTAFRFDSQPLPDPPGYILWWMRHVVGLSATALPATAQPYEIISGYLYVPHPANMDEPWPLLIHPQGPLIVPLIE